MTILALPIPSAAGSLEAYLQAANRFPILTREQETEYARRFRRWASSTFPWTFRTIC
ncbi:MAG: hypothetical protein HYV99_01710, partial [Betaproteobacteria bacterium]|nr:hypothetical protein [Betaproteobacteria bacterium]